MGSYDIEAQFVVPRIDVYVVVTRTEGHVGSAVARQNEAAVASRGRVPEGGTHTHLTVWSVSLQALERQEVILDALEPPPPGPWVCRPIHDR